jgi:hypothetical protein
MGPSLMKTKLGNNLLFFYFILSYPSQAIAEFGGSIPYLEYLVMMVHLDHFVKTTIYKASFTKWAS